MKNWFTCASNRLSHVTGVGTGYPTPMAPVLERRSLLAVFRSVPFRRDGSEKPMEHSERSGNFSPVWPSHSE